MLLEKIQEFFPERDSAVMRFLIRDVAQDLRHIRLTHTKRPETELPREQSLPLIARPGR